MDDWHDETYPELRDGPPWVMEEMIAATTGLPAGILARPEAAPIGDAVLRAARAGEPVVLVGCGTSLHGALAIADLLEDALERAGAPARVEARDAFEAALAPRRGGVAIGVSHDGGTHATTLALAAAAEAGAQAALVTHRPDGACARPARLVLPTPTPDRSWCHTVAYTSSILAGAALAERIAPTGLDAAALGSRMAALHASLAAPAAAGAGVLAAAARVVCAGSGADRVASRELTLKLEEGPQLPAAHRDLEILLHGHLVACTPGSPIVLVALDPRGRPRRLERAALLCDAAVVLETPVVLVADAAAADRLAGHAAVRACLPTGAPAGPQPLDALLAGALALQLLTLATVEARGTNPDLIRREEEPWRVAAAILDTPDW